MENRFMAGLKDTSNLTTTENMAVTRKSTKSDLYDMFALGAAMRTRSDEDVILMFRKAYKENPMYALKCLFYLRDAREGQGERRFFRTVLHDLAKTETESARRNMQHIPFYGRWDDLYALVDTPLEKEMFDFLRSQLALDVTSKTPSLLAKWLKSENTSSVKSRELAKKTCKAFGMTHKQYRKTLSVLRERINVLERLMSENRWSEIEFDKIPSRAGFIYRNAFARHDVERMRQNPEAQSYADFAKDETKTVNAKVLYPYECVNEAFNIMGRYDWRYTSTPALDNTNRLMVNKYWDNLEDYFKEAVFNGMAVVDTSGSMVRNEAAAPINVAISLGMYCAEKAKGPFANHFMTFSSSPTFVEIEGVDFCDKVKRMLNADWGGSTNVEAAFDLMLNTALRNHCTQEDFPENLIIISDMEFNACATSGPAGLRTYSRTLPDETLFETMEKRWATYGFKLPKLIFWNVDARQNNIPMKDTDYITFVSGMSPVLFEQIMKGKSGQDLMFDKLNSERYERIS